MRGETSHATTTIALVTVAATLIFFFKISGSSLWNDECFSYFVSYRGPVEAIHFIIQDTQPPFYYFLLSLWLKIDGSVTVLRLLSVLSTIVCIPILYSTARRLAGDQAALFSTLIFMTNPNIVNWAQKARPYALQTMLVAICFWGFVRVVTDCNTRKVFIGSNLRKILFSRVKNPDNAARHNAGLDVGWVAYALGGSLAMLAQQPAGFFVLACNCVMAVNIARNLRTNRLLLINWIIAQLILIAVWLLWLPSFLTQIHTNLTPAMIAARHTNFIVDLASVLTTARNLLSVPTLWSMQPPFVVLYGIVALAGLLWTLRRRQLLLIPALVVIPLVVCLIGFHAVHPVFGYVIYTFVWIWLPYSMLLALGLQWLASRPLTFGVLGVLLAGNALGLINYYRIQTVPLDRATEAIETRMQAGDGLILSKYGAARWGIAYYLGRPYQGRLVGLDIASEQNNVGEINTLDLALRQPRNWVVFPDGEQPAVALESLLANTTLALEEHVGSLHLYRFDRTVGRAPVP